MIGAIDAVGSALATTNGLVGGSDELACAATVGCGSEDTGLESAADIATSALAALTKSRSAAVAICDLSATTCGGLSVNLTSAVSEGATRLTNGATLLVPLLAEPSATSTARTETGNAISRHHGAIAAQRGFMLTVPNHPSVRFLKRLSGERNAPPQASCAIRERNMADGRRQFTQFGHNCRAARTPKQPVKRSCVNAERLASARHSLLPVSGGTTTRTLGASALRECAVLACR